MVKNLPAYRISRFNPRVGKAPWRREWQPTPVFLPGESHGQRSLEGYSPWGRKESDTTERLTLWASRVPCDSAAHTRCEYPLCGSFQTTSTRTLSTDLGKRRVKPALTSQLQVFLTHHCLRRHFRLQTHFHVALPRNTGNCSPGGKGRLSQGRRTTSPGWSMGLHRSSILGVHGSGLHCIVCAQ